MHFRHKLDARDVSLDLLHQNVFSTAPTIPVLLPEI